MEALVYTFLLIGTLMVIFFAVFFRDVFTGIGAEVTEQVEFGAFQKLGDKSTKKQGAV